jgi:drug/metabolite transporter (DMT)-like permease
LLRVPDSVGFAESLRFVSREPLFAVLVAFFSLQFANWILVLSRADLSFAQPITALSYVTVSGASYVILGEELPWPRMTGVALIVAGVWLISSTDHRTNAPAGPVP